MGRRPPGPPIAGSATEMHQNLRGQSQREHGRCCDLPRYLKHKFGAYSISCCRSCVCCVMPSLRECEWYLVLSHCHLSNVTVGHTAETVPVRTAPHCTAQLSSDDMTQFRDETKQDTDRDGWNDVLYHWMIDRQCVFYSWYSHKTDVYYILLYCGNWRGCLKLPKLYQN